MYLTKKYKNNKFYYLEAGDRRNPVILFLHGYADSARMFQPLFEQLSTNYHCIALDFPTIHPPHQIYNLGQLSRYVNVFVKIMALSDFYLVGFSMGGLVAIDYTSRHKNKVQKLILLNISPKIYLPHLAKAIIRRIQPTHITPAKCRFFAKLHSNPFVRRLLRISPADIELLNRISSHNYSIYSTLYNILYTDFFALDQQKLMDKYLSLKIKKIIALSKDDKIINWNRYHPYLKSKTQVVTLKSGGHAQNPDYWENLLPILKTHI